MQASRKVAIVGGDEREGPRYPDGVEVLRYGSSHCKGNGGLKRVLAAIAAGRLAAVVVLVRWLGHPAADRVRDACRRRDVVCLLVPGGESSAVRGVREMFHLM